MKTRPIAFSEHRSPASDLNRRVARAAIAALVLLGPLTITPSCAPGAGRGADLIAAITQSVGGKRIIEPRLTGTFDHQPCVVPPMSDGVQQPACPSPDGSLAAATRASTLLAEAARGEAAGNALYASGLWDLLWHEVDGGIDRAITKLHGAVAADPTNAEVLTSLTAAYVVRAQSRNRPTDLFQALDLATEAVSLDPASPPALFNHALVLERLFFNARAIEAWDRYLAVDVSGPWAAEARGARDRLAADASSPESTSLVSEHASPTTAQDAIVEQHLAAWAQLVLDGENGPADELLDRIEAAVQAIFKTSGDSLLVEETAFLRNLLGEPDRRETARAYIELATGIDAIKGLRIQRASEKLAAAERRLSRMDSPLVAFAEYNLLVGEFQNTRYDHVLGRATDWITHLAPDRSVLSLRLQSLLALVHGVTAKHDLAISSYEIAQAMAERIGDRDTAARIAAELGHLSATMGETATAWNHRYRVLALSSSRAQPRRTVTTRSLVAGVASSHRFDRAAQYLADDVVLASKGLPTMRSFALNNRARGEIAQDNIGAALEDLEVSRRQLVGIQDPGIRAIVEDDINLLVGQALTKEQPARATQILKTVDQHFDARGHALMSALSKSALAKAQCRLGQYGAANSTLERAVEILEAQASALRNPEQRLGFASQARETFDRLILLRAIQLDDPLGALDVVERNSGLGTDEDSRLGRNETPKPRVTATSEDRQARVVIYRVLADRILAWVTAPDATELRQLETDGAQLERAVRRLQAAATAEHAAAMRTELAWLYDALIAPISDLLGNDSNLQVIPDRTLHQVPFSALLESATGRFLVEDHAVVVAPYGSLSPRASQRNPPTSVLVVADPSLPANLASRFGRLPNARIEAVRIASLYQRETRLSGSETQIAHVQAELANHDVVHFAVHAVPADHDGGDAYLVLAPHEDTRLSGLTAATISELRIDQHPLVVLASCDTAGGQLGANAGATSLAGSFLQAGASAVVASLWEVDDEATEALMFDFHQRLVAGAIPAEALRLVQLSAMRRSTNRRATLAHWAAFQVFMGRAR